jgi:hypothetical protein
MYSGHSKHELRYDMAFDSRWAYFRMAEALALQAGLIDDVGQR